MNRIIDIARKAKVASGVLARLSREQKDTALERISHRITAGADRILSANEQDLKAARPRVASGELADALFRRLKLDQSKLRDIVTGVEQVVRLADPVGEVTYAVELDRGLTLSRVNCPIGVVGVIFESRPDALVQIATLCLKSGNAVILKGGREAEHSNAALFDIIKTAACAADIPADALWLLESREDVKSLLGAEGYVDLLVPRGSNELVRYIQQNTNIPVLGHAEGLCHVYVDREADLEKALAITIDAKVQYPAVCNAMETLLVHSDIAGKFLPRALDALASAGVELRCDERTLREFPAAGSNRATEADWKTEYCDLILSIRIVDSLDEAIRHINTYGSNHTDAIVTEDRGAFDRFFAEVDSAGVFLNASTRFADGLRYGFGAEVGISTGKLHPRGPVGLEGLVTYKYKLIGDGHVVATYSGPHAKQFIHKRSINPE
ncbi:MAG TPA: glutamate-5-semialdehyde dehydrogenase [Blastocatellia bacterium]|nr:glutamate-5-semialdehyde dehydrogenase [Blastocatellia bacterium]